MNPEEHQNTLDQQEWRAQCAAEGWSDYKRSEREGWTTFWHALLAAFAIAVFLAAITWIFSA